MTTYRSIASTETDPDSPVTATLMQALADNPTAISEGAVGAPYLGLQPYNGVLVDDVNDGLIYDFAVDGAVSSIQTPELESGYLYTVRVINFSHNSGSSQALELEKYGVSDNLLATSTLGSSVAQSVTQARRTTIAFSDDYNPSVNSSIPQTPIKYMIILWESGASFDAGRLYLFKELNYSARIE